MRQYLRNSAPDAEKILWSKLKGRQIVRYKFRRQQGIESYVVDFYCPESKLAIEIDGATHSTKKQIQHDQEKEKCLKRHEIQLLRFTNNDVYQNLEGVLTTVGPFW